MLLITDFLLYAYYQLSDKILNITDIQVVWVKFYMQIYIIFFLGLARGIYTHYASFESLDSPSFICMMTERMDDWIPPESWKRITCIMMIHAGERNN